MGTFNLLCVLACVNKRVLLVLNERKKRRLAKKAILNPKSPSDTNSDEENQDKAQAKVKDKKASEQSRRKGAGQAKSAGLSAGIALMHGFTATNVGKTRLTVTHIAFWRCKHR